MTNALRSTGVASSPAGTVADAPPMPSDPQEMARIQTTRQRWRLLYSQYGCDVQERLARQLATVRREAWGAPDLTAAPYEQMWEQVAVSYDTPPDVVYPTGGEPMGPLLEDAGLWSLMQRFQRDLLGLREMLMHVAVDEEGTVSFRPVRPDMVGARANPYRRDEPVRVEEWIRHETAGWVQHIMDISDPSAPYYVVVDPQRTDITRDILGGGFTGSHYPYRRADGTPVLPYVLYHAKRTGYLWDANALAAVAEGSINICVLLTFYGHVVRNTAWRQRYLMGAEPRGSGVEAADGGHSTRSEVITDPGSVVLLDPQEGFSGQPLVGTWDQPVDPEALLRSIAMYERRILSAAGLSPADVTRQTADIRSGYSLAVAREAVRSLQARVEPQLRRGDRSLLALTAVLHNRATGGSLPEEGYEVNYTGVGETPMDAALHREAMRMDIAAGLLSPVDAYMELHPGISRENAIRDLVRIANETRMFRAMQPDPEPPPPPPQKDPEI